MGCLRSIFVSICSLAIVLAIAAVLMSLILVMNTGLPQSDEAYIGGILGVDLPAYSEKAYEDTHGGFHGDGSAWYMYEFNETQAAQLQARIDAAPHWRALPMTRQVERFLFGGDADGVPHAAHAGTSGFELPDEGAWFFFDEQGEGDARYSDEGFLNRHSINIKCAVYDKLGCRLLFFELDT